MKEEPRVLALVLAGGEGKRLAPLTRALAKPAVPFHDSHRLIDFALSNLWNSGCQQIYVLAQYRSESVTGHLAAVWSGRPGSPQFVRAVVGGVHGMDPFRGTADAVHRCRHLIAEHRPDVVAVFGADHVYRMDVRQMIDHHLATEADATIATLPVPLPDARQFGVVDVEAAGRVRRFVEKPTDPRPMPGRPDHALASMGNYLFRPAALLRALDDCRRAGLHDFGGHLLPRLLEAGRSRLMAYDFSTNQVGASKRQGVYWRDVGTVDAYFEAHMDTQGPLPRFDIVDPGWPIRSAASAVPWTRPGLGDRNGALNGWLDSSRASGPGGVVGVIVRDGAAISPGASLERCVIHDGVSVAAGCRLRNVIVASDNVLPAGVEIGFDPVLDRQRFPTTDGGIVVVPSGAFPGFAARVGIGASIALPTRARPAALAGAPSTPQPTVAATSH
jgi:glucose-1-phosphate adenylyltransferase